jgi:hypothetical protein
MKKLLLILVCALLSCGLMGQNNNALSDINKIAVCAVMPENDNIPLEARNFIQTKLEQIITSNGMSNRYSDRFVLTAKINVVSKDIVASTPARVSQKIEVTFLLGDVMENRIYGSYIMNLSGIGTNEVKAFISAFKSLNIKNEGLADMLADSKEKIVGYYADNGESIIKNAIALANTKEYDEAIYQLLSIPDVCGSTYTKAQEVVQKVYLKMINDDGFELYNQAKTEWMQHKDSTGASNIANIINKIDPQASCYGDVEKLRQDVSEKLEDISKQTKMEADLRAIREWNFKMKQYDDSIKYRNDALEARKAESIAWASHQPKTVLQNAVLLW